MKFLKHILLSALILYLLVFKTTTMAVEPPSFPSCTNPSGTLKVSYNSGIHGIIGSPNNYSGTDSVYTLSDDTLLQCFCAEDKNGIQTNWWKASSLTDEEIDELKNQGWEYIPSGSVWGLSDEPYLAKNSNYSCGSTSTNGGGSSTSGGGTGGNVLAASAIGDVLGLAATGDSLTVYGFGLLGLSSLSLGLYLRKKNT